MLSILRDRRGVLLFGLPLVIAIPLLIIGVIILYFLLKALIGLVLQAVMWTAAIGFVALTVYVMYLIITRFGKKTRRK